MSQWCCSALCGHPLPTLTDNGTHDAASRHTIAPISHTRPSPRSRGYYSFHVPLRIGGVVYQYGVSRVKSMTQVANLLHFCSFIPNLPRTLPFPPWTTGKYWKRCEAVPVSGSGVCRTLSQGPCTACVFTKADRNHRNFYIEQYVRRCVFNVQ